MKMGDQPLNHLRAAFIRRNRPHLGGPNCNDTRHYFSYQRIR
jgi:hypothetical protein